MDFIAEGLAEYEASEWDRVSETYGTCSDCGSPLYVVRDPQNAQELCINCKMEQEDLRDYYTKD